MRVRGAYVAGDMHSRGHAWQGVCVAGGHAWQGACVVGACMTGGMHGRRDGHCNGQYASYWNAFLSITVCTDSIDPNASRSHPVH